MRAECKERLLKAINEETLGHGSVAEGEYMRNIYEARQLADGLVRWVEVCYCPTPLQEERTYWEEYFEITRIQDAHDRRRCRDLNGSEPWACDGCDCTARLQNRLNNTGAPFLDRLRSEVEFQKGLPSRSFSGAPATPPPRRRASQRDG